MALTNEQSEALWDAEGRPVRIRRVVSARPGTGKTTTLTQYCIALAEDWNEHYASWQGLAAISYTNVAKDELERKIRGLGKANALLSSPHFVGTIDSFLNQYLFLPFGATAMNATSRPKLVGEPYSTWRASPMMMQNKPTGAYSPIFFDCYSVGPDDRPLRTDTAPRKLGTFKRAAEKVTENNLSKIMELKKFIWEQGFAIQNDANYFAHKVLVSSPELTKFFVKRFPVLIIDEAQDMTEVQHALLDHLKQSGQEHMVLIGDEYQAIYEWNTARPQLFVDKESSIDWTAKTITGTFRCSPPICSVLSKLAADGVTLAPSPGSKNGTYSDAVQITGYDDDLAQQAKDIRIVVDRIASKLSGRQAHDDNKDNLKTIAVLTRSRDDADRLQAYFGGEVPTPRQPIFWESKFTKDYLKIIYHALRKDYYRAFKAYEALLYNAGEYESKPMMRLTLNKVWNPEDPTPLTYRKTIFEDLDKLFSALPHQGEVLISASANYCELGFRCMDSTVAQDIKNDCSSFRQTAKQQQDRSISSLLTSRDERTFFQHPSFTDVKVVFSTVHGVKGETYDGVLYFTKGMTSSCGCTPAKRKWADILHHSLIVCENKRIVYVALSRAAQMLCIMAPSSSTDAWEELL